MKFVLNRRNPNKKNEGEIKRIFRSLFLSPDGQEALRILLYDWSFFDVCGTEAKRALNEYAKYFLSERLGLAGINVYVELDPAFRLENVQKE